MDFCYHINIILETMPYNYMEESAILVNFKTKDKCCKMFILSGSIYSSNWLVVLK